MEENPAPRRLEAWQEDGFAGSGNQNDELAYLRDLTSCVDLEEATSLRVVVNSRNATISHLGRNLPNLIELNLSTSIMESIRDIGTGFQLLQVLWVPRCGLDSLDGISGLPALRELYASYNDIADLQPLADSCPYLEVLDLECNQVSDLDALQVLSSGCPSLQSLNLSGCPISQGEGFIALSCKAIPSLTYLNDVPISPAGNGDGTCRVSTLPPPFEPLKLSHYDSEIHLVREGIKHARVGVDSHEFRELEIALMVASSSPSGTLAPSLNVISGGDEGSAPTHESRSQLSLQQLTAVASSSILPASASSWMRCSQQGSLPGMASLQQGSNGGRHPSFNSSGVDSRASTASLGSRPSSVLLSTEEAGAMGASSSFSLQRPSTQSARPFSARPNASGGASSSGRPQTSSLIGGALGSSAPPTAGSGGGQLGGGLYWKKNRVNAVDHSSAGSFKGSGRGGGANQDEDEEDAASSLTFGGEAALVGGGLARDLRRRKNQQPRQMLSGQMNRGPSPPSSQGSLLDAFSQPSSWQASKGGVQEGWATRRKDVNVSQDSGSQALHQERQQGDRHASSSVSKSLDSKALLEELRRWKVETADVALMPAEEEGGLMSGTGMISDAWPGATDDGGGEAKVDVLNMDDAESRPSPINESLDQAMERNQSSDKLEALSTGILGLSINIKPVMGTPLRLPSALGRPPLSPMPSFLTSRTGIFKSDLAEEGKLAMPSTPSRANGSLVGLAPVLGARPVRPSKMLLQKAIMDAFPGRVVCKTIPSAAAWFEGAGDQMELIHSLSLKGRASENLPSSKVTANQGREVDLKTLNPKPRAPIGMARSIEDSDEF